MIGLKESLWALSSDVKKTAGELLAKVGLPSGEEESWRKISSKLKGIDFHSFQSKGSESSIELEGASFLSLDEASKISSFQNILEAYWRCSFDADVPDYFSLDNLSHFTQSLFIRLEEGRKEPTVIRHQLLKGNSLRHRVFCLIPDHTQAILIEEFIGKEDISEKKDQPYTYWNVNTEVHCGRNTNISYLSKRELEKSALHFLTFTSRQDRDSRIFAGFSHSGGLIGKGRVLAVLGGENSEFRAGGIYLGNRREFHDMEIIADHQCSHTQSSLLYKAVVSQSAHSVFDGNLLIPKNCKDIESHQLNHNIIMDREARAESMPRLIIQSEKVSCEHGATVGFLDEEALFFLMSRGFNEQEAKDILVEGFLAEVISEFPCPEKHLFFLQKLKNRLNLSSN